MADGSHIEWTDATWNPITGCSVVSPGCTNCYAMRLAGTRLKHHPSRKGLTDNSKAGPVWNGTVRFNEEWLDQPLRYTRPRLIFPCAHGDLFHESVPFAWIDRCFAVMALADRHRFQVLTKRSDRLLEYMSVDFDKPLAECVEARVGAQAMEIAASRGEDVWAPYWDAWWTWPMPHIWLGVSVEDQARANERIPKLLRTPAAVRWVSAEPLVGPVDIAQYLELGNLDMGIGSPGVDWVVAGGESGPATRPIRPMHPDWARSLRDQCAATDTAFFFKQWGDWVSVSEVEGDGPHHHFEDGATVRRVGKKKAGRTLDGVIHDGMPDFA